MEQLANKLSINEVSFNFDKPQKKQITFTSFFKISLYLFFILQAIYIYSAIYGFVTHEQKNKYYNGVSNTHSQKFYLALKENNYPIMEKTITDLMTSPSVITNIQGTMLFLEQMNNQKIPLSTKKKLATTIISHSFQGINAEKENMIKIINCKALDISCHILSSFYKKDMNLNITTQEKIIMANNKTISNWLETN